MHHPQEKLSSAGGGQRSSSGEDLNEFSVSFEQLDFISLQSRRGGISGGTGTRQLAEAVKDHLAMGRGEASDKKRIPNDEWERKLGEVKIRKEDMNKLVMNFFTTEGYLEAAKTFERESGTTPGIDLGLITDRMEIRRAVQSGDVQEAIERVNALKPEILEEGHHLRFHLQQQRLIELIREGQTQEALEFAQEYLAPHGEEDPGFLEELERTVALLAFEDAKASPIGELMEVSQRQKTASELNAAILRSQEQEQEARLAGLLKMLVWAQNQLDEKLAYPRINDLVVAQLSDTAPRIDGDS